MKKLMIGLVGLACILPRVELALAQGREQSRFDAVENGWVFDYRKAQRRARQTGKPMMIVLRCVP